MLSLGKCKVGTIWRHRRLPNLQFPTILAQAGIFNQEAGKSVKLDIGTVYKKEADGAHLFRYQVNGRRKAVGLGTRNLEEAVAKAKELVPIVKSTTVELISAHVKRARGLVFLSFS